MKRTDEQRLKLFADVVERGTSSRAIKENAFASGFTMTVEDGKLFQTLKGRDEELVRSFLVEFRRIVAYGEEALIHSTGEKEGIFQACARNLTDRELLDYTEANINAWNMIASGTGGIALSVDGRELRGLDLVKWYMNKIVFHDDVEGEPWKMPVIQPMMISTVDFIIAQLWQVAVYQKNVVNEGFERSAFGFEKEDDGA